MSKQCTTCQKHYTTRIPGNERPQLTFSTIHMTYKKDMASPFVTVTLRDANGAQLERTLETAPGVFDPKTHVLQLGHALSLQTPVTAIPQGAWRFLKP